MSMNHRILQARKLNLLHIRKNMKKLLFFKSILLFNLAINLYPIQIKIHCLRIKVKINKSVIEEEKKINTIINEHQSQQRLCEPTIKQNPNQPQLKNEIYYNKNEEIKVNRCAKISNNKLQQNYEHLEINDIDLENYDNYFLEMRKIDSTTSCGGLDADTNFADGHLDSITNLEYPGKIMPKPKVPLLNLKKEETIDKYKSLRSPDPYLEDCSYSDISQINQIIKEENKTLIDFEMIQKHSQNSESRKTERAHK